jgi:DNA-binding NarL/FixJ family response regulator
VGDDGSDGRVVHLSRWIAEQNAAGRLVGSQTPADLLSDRQLDIVRRLSEGRTSDEIAGALDLPLGTVTEELERIFSLLRGTRPPAEP